MITPTLIAHRGYTLQYPENTLLALERAVRAGARYVEFDIQLCADGTPVLLHDTDLKRMAGVDQRVLDMRVEELKTLRAGEAGRFGEKFKDTPFASLREIVEFLGTQPQVTAFVEIKRASLRQFGVMPVVQRVLETLTPVLHQCVVISFDADALSYTRTQSSVPIGWVFEPWSAEALQIGQTLQAEYLFTDHEMIPTDLVQLPQAQWRWALYEIADPQLALHWSARGAHMIETFAIGEMLHQLPQDKQDA